VRALADEAYRRTARAVKAAVIDRIGDH